MAQKGINKENEPAAGFMITKTFFLVKIIHRISAQNLRGKKSLRENRASYRAFSAFQAEGTTHVSVWQKRPESATPSVTLDACYAAAALSVWILDQVIPNARAGRPPGTGQGRAHLSASSRTMRSASAVRIRR
jgi:hypothetical protein